MEQKKWHIARLTEVGRAYWYSAVLHAALKTGIMSELVKAPATPEDLAQRLKLDTRATAMLLTAMAAQDMVRDQAGLFTLDPELTALMDPEATPSLFHYTMHMAYTSGAWAKLDQAVASGQALPKPPPPADGSTPPGQMHFYKGMRDLGWLAAPGLAKRLGMQPGWHVMDMGGGPGVYALNFAADTPGLKVTVLDLPAAKEFFEQTTSGHPAAKAVDFLTGDFNLDPLGGPYDGIWMSHILHSFDSAGCAALFKRVAEALKPGGRVWVQDFVLGAEGSAGEFAALFALNMLIHTEHGRTYSAAEIGAFMTNAGLEQVEELGRIRPQADGWIMGARKPE